MGEQMSGDAGAGGRARELAAAFNFGCTGADDHDSPDCGKCADMREQLAELLAGALAAVRLDTIEEIAVFAETHYCVIKADAPGGYKTESRAKHPNEPFARAIRALAGGERAVEGK